MSSTSDKVDGPAERDDKEGDAERENEQQQEISATSTAPQPQPQPPAEAAGTESNEEKSDDVDPLEKDIEKVRIFTLSLRLVFGILFVFLCGD
jgi:hypothetical protein